MMTNCVRIDIETELNAMLLRECSGCRGGWTHDHIAECDDEDGHYHAMSRCPKCNTMFNASYWTGLGCPVCASDEEIDQHNGVMAAKAPRKPLKCTRCGNPCKTRFVALCGECMTLMEKMR